MLSEYGLEADRHWREVMDLAEQYGFIVQSFAGTAILITHNNQLTEYGEVEYLRIQQMNGHCPKECGYPGCLDKDRHLKPCGNCGIDAGGAKWARFERTNKNKERGVSL